METFKRAADYRDPTSAAQRVRGYVRAVARGQGEPESFTPAVDHGLDVRDLDALVDAVDHGAGRVPVNRALAELRAAVIELIAHTVPQGGDYLIGAGAVDRLATLVGKGGE